MRSRTGLGEGLYFGRCRQYSERWRSVMQPLEPPEDACHLPQVCQLQTSDVAGAVKIFVFLIQASYVDYRHELNSDDA